MDGISKLLSADGFITINKTLIRELGLHEAIILGELCSEYNYWEKCNKLENDMFYSTRDNIEYNTGLSEHLQRKALKTLQEREIITSEKKGLPAVNYYKINFDKLLMLLSSSDSYREGLDIKSVNLNNNKQTKIEKQNNNSKELLLQKSEFSFGKAKSKKPDLYSQCISILDSYDFSSNPDIRNLLIQYLKYRLQVKDKPLYANMWKGMLNKLAEICDNDITLYRKVIQQSIERGYLAFYPVKESQNFRNVRESIEQLPPSEAMTKEDYRELERVTEERRKRGLRTEF